MSIVFVICVVNKRNYKHIILYFKEDMMKIKFKDSVLTVVTDIPAAASETNYKLHERDEDGNMIYAVSYSDSGSINSFSFGYNAVVDDKLALILVVPIGKELKDVKRIFGEELVAAKKHTSKIAADFIADEQIITDLFEDVETD